MPTMTTMPTAMTRQRSDDETVLIEALAIAMRALSRVTVALPMTPSQHWAGDAAAEVLDLLGTPERRSLLRDYLVEMRRR